MIGHSIGPLIGLFIGLLIHLLDWSLDVSFLDADTQEALSVRRSVRPSVRPSVRASAQVEKWENKRFRTFSVADSCISAPAHPSATDGRVSSPVSKSTQTVFVYHALVFCFYFGAFYQIKRLKVLLSDVSAVIIKGGFPPVCVSDFLPLRALH